MTFSQPERTTLAGLADVLIPASGGFPSASEAGAAAEGLDQVLAVRPDLAGPLKEILKSAQGGNPAEFVSVLQTRDPAGLGALAEAVAGAYFMNPQVRGAIRYYGQTPRPIDPATSDLNGELVKPVVDRGSIYRSTPETEKSR